MHRISRSKVSIVLSLLTLLALVGGFVATGMGRGQTSTAHAASASYTVKTGHLTLIKTVNLASLSTAPAPRTGKTRVMPFHSTRSKGGAALNSLKSPVTVGTAIATGSLLHNFNGASSVDSMNANGFDLEPPDQGLCVGNGQVIEVINLVFTDYRPNGTILFGPFAINLLFGESPTEFLSDPRCYFDPATHDFFFTILAIDPTNTASHTDIAVFNSVGLFVNEFQLDTTDLTDPGCPCFGDQPLFGIDQFNIYISNNEFPISVAGFNGAQVYAISKSQLVAGDPTPNFVHFGNLGIGGTIAASVEPAITNDSNAKAEYFLNSLDPFSTFDNRIGVWAMTNRSAVTTGIGVPNFTSTVITSEAYGFPPSAETPVGFNSGFASATSGLITTDDDRMLRVQEINGQLWSSLNTAITIAGETGTRSAAAWFEVRPSLNGNIIGTTTITNQGYVAVSGNYLLYPAVAAQRDGNVAMTMTLTGPNTFPSAAFAIMKAGSKSFSSVQIAASGVTADNGFTAVGGPGRWGDYSAAVNDPNGHGTWMATEYIPGTGDIFTNWGTRVFEVAS